MASLLGRMRGASPTPPSNQPGQQQQQLSPQQQQQLLAQQQQQQQVAAMAAMNLQSSTPRTPHFPGQGYSNMQGQQQQQLPQNTVIGVHDCIQLNGGKPLYLCQPFVKAALVKGSFRTITAVPKYVDGMEWVAVNLVDFFHNINLFLGIVSEHCTRENCPTMSAGPGMDYTWTSGPQKKQIKVPAPEYTDYVLTWAEKLIGDETMFPTKSGREFSPAFPKTAVHLYTQFLRIFAHLYHAHFRDILHLSLEAHLNSLFAHFLMFGLTFELLDPKECRAPREGWGFVIGDLIDAWRAMGILEVPQQPQQQHQQQQQHAQQGQQ